MIGRQTLVTILILVTPLAAALNSPIKTASGLVAGVPGSDPAITAFKAIPFAAPPVGSLRWHAPRPPAAWQGIRRSDRFSDSCVQNIVQERKPWTYEFMAHNNVSEDCLYLNVWTPARAGGEKHPVYVWMHGGGYVEGSTAAPVYDGERLARRGVVVVTINYRLGLLGFLAHPELSGESDHHVSGNYGTLDQIAALEWVRKNIAGFGGDPGNVTIGGQSAGASSVHNLVASPLAKGLFQRAIAESGSAVTPNNRSSGLKEAEEQGAKFAQSRHAASLAALRAMKWQDVVSNTVNGPSSGFRPVVDGYVMPSPMNEIFAQGKQNDVPTLTGLNADEASSQADYGQIPAAQWREQIGKRFGDQAAAFLKVYPAANDAQAGVSQKAASRDQGRVSMYLWAANRAKTAKTKLFTYYWDHAEPGPDSARYAAFHTSEVPYVFNTLNKSDRPWTAADRKIADTLGAYWVNFMTTGDPNGKGLAAWPAFDGKPVTMEIGDKYAPRPVADKAAIDFFSQYLMR